MSACVRALRGSACNGAARGVQRGARCPIWFCVGWKVPEQPAACTHIPGGWPWQCAVHAGLAWQNAAHLPCRVQPLPAHGACSSTPGSMQCTHTLPQASGLLARCRGASTLPASLAVCSTHCNGLGDQRTDGGSAHCQGPAHCRLAWQSEGTLRNGLGGQQVRPPALPSHHPGTTTTRATVHPVLAPIMSHGWAHHESWVRPS